MSKIIKNTGFLLLIMTFLAAFALFISGFCGIHKYLVVSSSMEPSLYAGDIVFVNSNTAFDDVEIGDVIIFKYKDMNVIHRVVDEAQIDGKRYLKTKGDANAREDGYLTTEGNYCGKALFNIDKIGYAVDFTHQIKKQMKGSDEMWQKLKKSGLEIFGAVLTITDILVTIFL